MVQGNRQHSFRSNSGNISQSRECQGRAFYFNGPFISLLLHLKYAVKGKTFAAINNHKETAWHLLKSTAGLDAENFRWEQGGGTKDDPMLGEMSSSHGMSE